MKRNRPRLIVASNRLPISVLSPSLRPSSGGLVTALTAVFREHSGFWIGGADADQARGLESSLTGERTRFIMVPVFLTNEERRKFYCGFSNEIIWPLFHDLHSPCNFDPAYWGAYLSVNERFAGAIASVATRNDFIWVHDYHLVHTAACLRERGVGSTMAFFQHIPFPCPDIFEKMPWREEFLDSILRFDVVGFQTRRDRQNFVNCVRRILKSPIVKRNGQHLAIGYRGRWTNVGTFPISIDFEEFAGGAHDVEVARRAAQIRSDFGSRQVVLGVDRLDYTKGCLKS